MKLAIDNVLAGFSYVASYETWFKFLKLYAGRARLLLNVYVLTYLTTDEVDL